MAFDLHPPVTGLPVSGLFATAIAGSRNAAVDGVLRMAVLRCETCGDEIPFNALSAVCRCSQECYAPQAPTRTNPAAG